MTVDDLIAEARRNSTGQPGAISPSDLSGALRVVLKGVLESIDYEANLKSSGAISARLLAAIIKCTDAEVV